MRVLTTSLPPTGSTPTLVGRLTQCRNTLRNGLVSAHPSFHDLSVLPVILKNALYDGFRVV